MAEEIKTAGTEAGNVAGAITRMGIGELIANMATGIADGQRALDQTCMEIAEAMGRSSVDFNSGVEGAPPDKMSLIELGFTPNFYQFVDTILEIKVAVSSKFEEKRTVERSDAELFQDQQDSHNEYKNNSSHSSSGGSSSYGASWGWGRGWYGGGYGARSGQNSYANSSSSENSGSASHKRKTLKATTVDATYASTYGYSVEASSTIKTKIVPIPAPDVFEEIIRAKIQQRKAIEEQNKLRVEVRAMLPEILGLIDTALDDADGLKKTIKVTTPFTKKNADNVVASMTAISTGFAEMSNGHWAAIPNSLAPRQAIDDAMQAASAAIGTLADTLPTDGSDTDETKATLVNINAQTAAIRAEVVKMRQEIEPQTQTETQEE